MGRPERPVDPEAGAVQRLAHQLRELRAACGGPSYREMARRAHYSAATLAQAAGGERLPSLAVVLAYVQACDADPREWETRWKAAAEEERAVRQEGGGGGDEPPYRGLVRFEPGDESLFFGRERLVGELLELVCEHRLAMVFGASGSGKSSLLRAGLIPRLRRRIQEDGCAAVLRVLTPGATPAATHGHLLTPGDGGPDRWVVVDQFEEIFTLCRDRKERARFIELLLAAREPRNRLRVVIAVRADFYDRCAEHRGLVDALREAHLPVGPMDATELREAVVRPAAAAGLLVERELTARIIDEVVDRPGALPMLSHALLETWHRRHGRTLTMAAYEAAGGVSGAIAATAEHLYGDLSPGQARTARQVLLRLIEPGQGTADTRRPVRRGELDVSEPELCEVVERLARARLLTVDADCVELAHEALINSWPRLRGWVEEDRERLRHHRSLTQAAQTWDELGRDTGTLYRGTRLAQVEEMFAAGLSPELNTLERDFLTAALDARAHEHRTATRTARRARRLVVSLSVAVTLSLVTGLVAWQLHRNGVRERTETAARRIASVAASMRTTDPRTAMLLSVAAWRTAPLTESRSALLGALTQPQSDAFTAPGADGDTPRFLADSGRTVLSTEGRTWRTWDVATHRRRASGHLPYGTVLAAAPDARVVVLQVPGGQRLWDVAARRWTGPARALPSSYDLDFGASGRSYVVADPDRSRTQLRSVANDRLLYGTSGTGEPDLVPSPDDRRVAVCREGHAPAVRDLAKRRTLHGGWESARDICDDPNRLLRFGAGDRLTALSTTGIRAWDTTTGRLLADVYYPDVQYAALSEDGRFLAASCRDEIRVWRVSAPVSRYAAPVFRYPLNGQLPSASLAWDPRLPVLRYLEGSTVHTLDMTTPLTSRWRQQPLDNALLSPDGRILATAERTAERTGGHYRFQLRDTEDGRLLRELPSPPFPVAVAGSEPVVPQYTKSLMAFSPDSGAFAYGVSTPGRDAAPQRLTVWNVTGDRERTTLDITSSSTGTAVALALGPGGRTLLAARTPGTPHLTDEVWDVARHRRTAVLKGFDSHLLAVRPDGRLLVGGSHSAALPAGPVTARALGQSGRIGALAFGADGSRMAAGDLTGRVALWDGDLRRRAGILPNVFPGPALDTPEAVSALAFSPDGRTLAVAGDAGTVQLWDTATQQPLGGTLPTPGEGIRSLAFSPDNGTLYVAGDHVPLQHYALSASAALTQVCARAGTTLTRAQWRAYIPDAPYQHTCEQR